MMTAYQKDAAHKAMAVVTLNIGQAMEDFRKTPLHNLQEKSQDIFEIINDLKKMSHKLLDLVPGQ